MNEQQHAFEQVITCACQLVAKDRAVQRVEVLMRRAPSAAELLRLHEQADRSGLRMWIRERHGLVLEVFSRFPASAGDAVD